MGYLSKIRLATGQIQVKKSQITKNNNRITEIKELISDANISVNKAYNQNINNLANKIADYGAKYEGDTDVGKVTINGTEHDIRNAVRGFDKKLVSDILFDQFEKYFSSNSSGALKLNGSDILDPTINLEMFWEIFKNYVYNNQGISDIDGSYPFADFAVWILALILAGLDILQIYNMVNDTKNDEVVVDDAKEEVEEIPDVDYPGDDPTVGPPGTEWRGDNPIPGSREGNWHNPETKESWHPDLDHPEPIGPHWDYKNPLGEWRIFPDGSILPK